MKAMFSRRFSAAHRLPDDPSPCKRIHGHNWEVLVEIDSDGHGSMVLPAEVIKKEIDERFDHKLILYKYDPLKVMLVETRDGYPSDRTHWDIESEDWVVRVPHVPTTENLARFIAEGIWHEAAAFAKDDDHEATRISVKVALRETPTIMAICEVEATL